MARYDLPGRVALVTGGARGIGFETAEGPDRSGASVAIKNLGGQCDPLVRFVLLGPSPLPFALEHC